MSTRLVNMIKGTSGLRIELREECREDVQEISDNQEWNAEQKFMEVLEYELGNGWGVVPKNSIALEPDTLIIYDSANGDVDQDEQGDIIKIHRCYWYAQYDRFDEVAKLLEDGYIILSLNEGEEEKELMLVVDSNGSWKIEDDAIRAGVQAKTGREHLNVQDFTLLHEMGYKVQKRNIDTPHTWTKQD